MTAATDSHAITIQNKIKGNENMWTSFFFPFFSNDAESASVPPVINHSVENSYSPSGDSYKNGLKNNARLLMKQSTKYS